MDESVLLWSSLNSTGSSRTSSSAYISASKQLKSSRTTVRFPELVSIEHQGATASRVLTSGSTSSKCFLPNVRIGLHLNMVSDHHGLTSRLLRGNETYLNQIPEKDVTGCILS